MNKGMHEMKTKKCDVCEEFKDVKELDEIHGILVCDRCFERCADCEFETIARIKGIEKVRD